MKNKPIFVTQPSLADLNELMGLLEGVWERGILTHNGPLLQQLEKELTQKINASHLSIVSNGTVALQIAIKALDLKGEIITTPFTWVATVSAIKWEGCTPVFCDIDPETLNIDPAKIEALISDKTVAIMPVHVFGTACNVKAIEKIAKKHNLKVIYDAAHAIGTEKDGECIMNYGDISATSLHATKLFNTGEGGACITKDPELHRRMQRIRFFGHNEEKDVVEDGFNGKLTEIHAALGLANIELYDQVLSDRKIKYKHYKERLQAAGYHFQKIVDGETNYSYFPVIFDSEEQLLSAEKKLNENNIFPRRYFYPSVNTYTKIVAYQAMPVSEDISKRILCLPLYFSLSMDDVDRICDLLLKN